MGRFIPTCVGKIQRAVSNKRNSVHPHVCGENGISFWYTHFIPGSSPRVWGKWVLVAILNSTCAVHPHVCGENALTAIFARRGGGSSPRVWGKCWVGGRVNSGKTVHPHVCGENVVTTKMFNARVPVHPHVCGENTRNDTPRVLSVPPRVWGKSDWRLGRFIPTCVGKILHSGVMSPASYKMASGQPVNRFIPTCVGKISEIKSSKIFNGSSPRVWGK